MDHHVDRLQEKAAWLDLGECKELCRSSDDAVSAGVAAITARAAACRWSRREAAKVEGWTALRTNDLATHG